MDVEATFLAFGIAAAVFAVTISFVGLRLKDFPPSRGVLAGLITLGAILVVGTAVFGTKLQIEEQHERQAGEQSIPGESTTEAALTAPLRIPADAL